jgi:hypothetical protein
MIRHEKSFFDWRVVRSCKLFLFAQVSAHSAVSGSPVLVLVLHSQASLGGFRCCDLCKGTYSFRSYSRLHGILNGKWGRGNLSLCRLYGRWHSTSQEKHMSYRDVDFDFYLFHKCRCGIVVDKTDSTLSEGPIDNLCIAVTDSESSAIFVSCSCRYCYLTVRQTPSRTTTSKQNRKHRNAETRNHGDGLTRV